MVGKVDPLVLSLQTPVAASHANRAGVGVGGTGVGGAGLFAWPPFSLQWPPMLAMVRADMDVEEAETPPIGSSVSGTGEADTCWLKWLDHTLSGSADDG